VLRALGTEDRKRLAGKLDRVPLTRRQVLYDAGDVARYAYFPVSGLLSILAFTRTGAAVGIASVGNEGAIGWPMILDAQPSPHRVVVEVSGAALRIGSDALREELPRATTLQRALLRYTDALLAQISQSVVCQRFHTVPERLAHWLLSVRDRTGSHILRVTQDGMARVLGIPRTGVTAAAVGLKEAGVIRYRHGRMVIVNHERLERAACECYRARNVAQEELRTVRL
jgi:CRP-like cAMP-binding protein